MAALGTSPIVAVCLTGTPHSTTGDTVPARYLTRWLSNCWLHGRIHRFLGRTSGQFHLNFRKMVLESFLCKGSVMLVAPTQHHISTLILYHDLIYHPGIVCRSVVTCTSRQNRVLWLQQVDGGSTYQIQAHRSRHNKRFRPDACNGTQHGAFSSKTNLLLSICRTVDVWQFATELNTARCGVSVYSLCCSVLHGAAYQAALLWTAIDWRQSAFSYVITEGTTGEAIDRKVSGTRRPAERLVLRQRRRRFTGVLINP